jgi:hypothetical protein
MAPPVISLPSIRRTCKPLLDINITDYDSGNLKNCSIIIRLTSLERTITDILVQPTLSKKEKLYVRSKHQFS